MPTSNASSLLTHSLSRSHTHTQTPAVRVAQTSIFCHCYLRLVKDSQLIISLLVWHRYFAPPSCLSSDQNQPRPRPPTHTRSFTFSQETPRFFFVAIVFCPHVLSPFTWCCSAMKCGRRRGVKYSKNGARYHRPVK